MTDLHPSSLTCRICGGTASDTLQAREMMYGTRAVFDYFQCADCGCVQITDIPDNLGDYYPADYYSFAQNRKRVRPLKKFLRTVRARYAIERKGWFGRLLYAINPPDPMWVMYGDVGIKLADRLLDVGGGGGGHVWALRQLGHKSAIAADPFIAEDVTIDGTLVARKADVFSMDGTYDWITMHHSFEHMTQQTEVLARCRELLADSGRMLIRIPTASSFAWDHYRENWISLDAPRHLYLHTHDSIRRVAEDAGFTVDRMWCDSTFLQFWGSEQYARDIPLEGDGSYIKGIEGSIFTEAEIEGFKKRSTELNAEMRGDSLCVVLSQNA